VFRRTVQAGGVSRRIYVNSVSEARKRVAGHKKYRSRNRKRRSRKPAGQGSFTTSSTFLPLKDRAANTRAISTFAKHFAPDEVHLLVRDLGQRVEMVLNFTTHRSMTIASPSGSGGARIRWPSERKMWALLTSCWKTIVKPDKAVVSAVLAPGAQNFTHDHIAAQARRTPDALAVSSD